MSRTFFAAVLIGLVFYWHGMIRHIAKFVGIWMVKRWEFMVTYCVTYFVSSLSAA
jgi:hypothetical protein